jgi:hypothetical protein
VTSAGAWLKVLSSLCVGACAVLLVPTQASAATSLEDVFCTSSSNCIAVGGSDESGAWNAHAKRWNGTAWTSETIAPPNGASTSKLSGVTCLSASDCIAVGTVVEEEQGKQALLASWNGSSWATAPIPAEGVSSSELKEIACTSSSACVAVGSSRDEDGRKQALAMRWNGSAWSTNTHPQPSESLTELTGVSCVGPADCVAVGSFVNSSNVTKTLASVWNGTSWSVVATPEPGGAELTQLQDVSCRPSEACTAVGNYSDSKGEERTLALRRNVSGTWSIQPTPLYPDVLSRSLTAVSCSSSSSCTAVGFVEQHSKEVPMALAWNGTSWSSQSIDGEMLGASAVILTSVSCLSSSDCNATGSVSYGRSAAPRNLAFRFNGSVWLVTEQGSYERTWTTFDATQRRTELSGVACPGSHKCVAVGELIDDTGTTRTQVGVWKGGTWETGAGPAPPEAKESQLSGTACTSFADCWAVGAYVDSEDVQRPLLLQWDGSMWSIESPPAPSGAKAAVLAAVDCSSATHCVAVGSYVDSEGLHRPFAMSFDGSSWTLSPVPPVTGAIGSILTSVSCASAGSCMAVGMEQDGFGHEVGMAVRWNGTAWSAVSVPGAEAEGPSSLVGVSCPGWSLCMAVGSYRNVESKKQDLALVWNGTAWAGADLPSYDSSELAAVSCGSESSCVAVGRDAGASAEPTHVLRWNGTSWEAEPPADYLDASGVTLMSVSCFSSEECNATGTASYGALSQSNAMLAYDGGGWFAAEMRGSGAGLRGISCLSAESCAAVGDSDEPAPTSAAVWALTDEEWKAVDTAGAKNAYLADVSCIAEEDCVMVGRQGEWPFKPFAATWQGESLSTQATARPPGRSSNLEAVSCAKSSWCVAAGYSWADLGPGPTQPLIEIWDGSSWQLASIPLPGTAVATFLRDVSCSSFVACSAVGSYVDGSGVSHGLIVRWNGLAWSHSSISPPSGSGYRLDGISCTSSIACTAVGSATNASDGSTGALAARWNGASWAVETVPLPEGKVGSGLEDVDCFASTRCVASGQSMDAAGTSPLIVAWTQGTWEVETALNAVAEGRSNLEAVSCPTAADCKAVGRSQVAGRLSEPLMMQAEGEVFEDPTDPVRGPLEPSPMLTPEQKEEALAAMEEDPAFQAAVGTAEYEPRVVAWTESNEASEETLVGAYVEIALEEAEDWPEREWGVASYGTDNMGYESGAYSEIEVEASASEVEVLGIGVDLVFDAEANVIDGEAVEVFPLALKSGEVSSDEEIGEWNAVSGY